LEETIVEPSLVRFSMLEAMLIAPAAGSPSELAWRSSVPSTELSIC
jgi:hypothetical protein